MFIAKKVTTPKKYLDFANVFLKKSAAKLSERFNINKHAIDLEPSKQLLYMPIYSLEQVKLETFKTYIEVNLTNKIIWPSKSPAEAPILLIQNLDSRFCLNIEYYDCNNLIIKN